MRAQMAEARVKKLADFGPFAVGVYVKTPVGDYVVDPEDGFISAALLQQGHSSGNEFRILQTFITSQSHVFVVGAHIGTHAVRLSKICKSLVAIEANPKTYHFLLANLHLNQCANVTAYNIAASDKVEKIQFVMNRENSGGSKRMPHIPASYYFYDNPDVIEVNAAPLDTIIKPQTFDLVLMDIEGSEYCALKGMPKILDQTMNLSIEFMTHHLVNVANITADDLASILIPHFQWMYVPHHNHAFYPREQITGRIKAMFDAKENHENVFFIRHSPPAGLLNLLGRADPSPIF